MTWPKTTEELEEVQLGLARRAPEPWRPEKLEDLLVGGAFICFERGREGPGAPGDRAWAAAVLTRRTELVETALFVGASGEAFRSGWLALREGPLLEEVVRRLSRVPDVLLVDATGRDHPRRAGLALELGEALGVPTIGVTRRPLVARARAPERDRAARTPLLLGEELVGYCLVPATDASPIVVHAGWRTSPELAVRVVESCLFRFRTPEPLRRARQVARQARAVGLT